MSDAACAENTQAEAGTAWRPIGSCDGPDQTRVTLWLTIYASPKSMGWGDAFAVRDCWRQGGKWVHVYKGGPSELDGDYITHWLPSDVEPTEGPAGEPMDWWRA